MGTFPCTCLTTLLSQTYSNLFDLVMMYVVKVFSYEPEMMMMRWKAVLGKTKQARLGLRINSQTAGKSSWSQILDGSVPNTTSVRPCNYAHFGHHQLLQYYYLYFYYNHTVFDTYSQYRNYKYKYLYYHKYYVSSTLQLCSLRPPPPPAAAVLLLLLQSRCI